MAAGAKTLFFALLLISAFCVCLSAEAGMLFADGVEVDGGGVTDDSGAAAGSGYDVLPLTYEEMDRYDQIAMEPYRERYDELSMEEKAELYGRQFEYMRGRKPRFDPDVLNPPPPPQRVASSSDVGEQDDWSGDDEHWEDEEFAPSEETAREEARPSSENYDVLPLWFDDMDEYDQIAMEPYRSKYDAMPIAEKARIYGQQFEFMRGRAPNFNPGVLTQDEQYGVESGAAAVFAAKRHLYKPATPKKRLPKKFEPEKASEEELLGSLTGPWAQNAQPEPEPAPDEAVVESRPAAPERAGRRRTDRRMENLREGWNAIDVLRGARER